MSSGGVKLVDLKVADLKKELEERDLETTGNKATLRERLRDALLTAGEDPDSFLFETDTAKLTKELLGSVDAKLTEQLTTMDVKLNAVKDELGTVKEELLGSVDAKLNTVKEELLGSVDTKLQEMEGSLLSTVEEKWVNDLKSRISALENRSTGSPPSEQPMVEVKRENGDTPSGSSPHKVIPKFDGKTPWEEFMTIFETAANIHKWSPETRSEALCLALRGDAVGVLQGLPLNKRSNYNELVKRLEMRFGHKHMNQLYRSQLKNRSQKPNETLQEYEADIARLVRQAYPAATDEISESLAVDRFLDGLRDPETQQAVKLSRPATLGDALAQALEFEAVKQSVRGQARARVMGAESEPTAPGIEDLKNIIEDTMKRLVEAVKPPRRELRCWGCVQKGHQRNNCPTPKSKGPQEQEN